MPKEPNPADTPLTDEEFSRMNFRRGSDHLPIGAQNAIKNAIKAQQGRPPLENPKKQVTIRLNPLVLEKLKEDGKGWQTRLNRLLEEHFGLA